MTSLRNRAILTVALAAPLVSGGIPGPRISTGTTSIPLTPEDALNAIGVTESVRSLATSPSSDRLLLIRAAPDTRIEAWDAPAKSERWATHTERDWQLVTVGQDGHVYGVDRHSRLYDIRPDTADPMFRIAPKPESLAALPDGRFVFSAPSNGKLLHLYSAEGRWLRSFGDAKTFTGENGHQNQWLNQGRVLVGPQGILHYVFLNAPEPSYLTFSSDGELLGEHAIRTDGLIPSISHAVEYLKSQPSDGRGCATGGMRVLLSAAIALDTGNLWFLSSGGRLYEFEPQGHPRAQYVLTQLPDGGPIVDLVIDRHYAYLLGAPPNERVHRIERSRLQARLSATPFAFAHAALAHAGLEATAHAQDCCPPDEDIPFCAVVCPSPSIQTIDCRAMALNQLSGNAHKVGVSCGTSETSCNVSISQVCDPITCGSSALFGSLLCHSCNPCSGPGYVTNTAYCDDPPEPDPNCSNCCARFNSPIFVDLSGFGSPFSSVAEGVIFDVDGAGTTRRLAWPLDPVGDPWLVYDRNGNGEIDSLVELFGNMTPRPPKGALSEHGYQLLQDVDRNSDGWVDSADPVFPLLGLWSDVNRNGVSDPGELRTLADAGVSRLSVQAVEERRTDEWGNRFRFRSWARVHGIPRETWDVFVKSQSIPVR